MLVKIGGYKNWIGPYQLADLLKHVGVSEDTCFKIGSWLADKTPLTNICEFIHSYRKRKLVVKIHKYDTWNMDNTLAHIILPMLIQLKETKHGAPIVDDEDVPEELRSTSAPPKENEYDVDGNHFKRWDWVMDEMIFAFEHELDDDWENKFWKVEPEIYFAASDEKKFGEGENSVREIVWKNKGECDWDGRKAVQDRIDNGFRLFGKYYQALWD